VCTGDGEEPCTDTEGTCSSSNTGGSGGGSSTLPDSCDDKWDCPDTYVCHILSATAGECILGQGKSCTSSGQCEDHNNCINTTNCNCAYGKQLDNGSCYETMKSSPACTSDAVCPPYAPLCIVKTDLEGIPGVCMDALP